MMQFVRFSAIGVVNTVLSYAIFVTMVVVGVNYLICAVVSYVFGVTISYYMNSKLTFRIKYSLLTYVKFFTVNIFLLCFGVFSLFFLKEFVGLNVFFSQICVVVLRLPIAYFISHKVVFI